MRRRRAIADRRAALGLALLCLAICAPAWAQSISFGKNKVNYRRFDWHVLRSEHLELYYYPEEEALARAALAAAERSYRHHRGTFEHETSDRIPIILYSSQHDFEQTNITPALIPEGVAGLTETVRGRVLLPFDGSYAHFFHTLQHELVHAFQLSVADRLSRERGRSRSAAAPLWFTEGLAEHWSTEWDADGHMILRDLVISGRLPALKEFWQYQGSFAMYKLGQSVIGYIEETYGADKLMLFYTEAHRARRFSDLFPEILGVTEEEFSSRWMHAMRERYYPDVITGDPIFHSARQVSQDGSELKPVPVPDGVPGFEDAFVFFSQRSGYGSIYSASLSGEEENLRTLVRGERSAQFLSFHDYRSRMDIAADGRLVFSSHSGERDILVVHDLVTNRTLRTWGFEELVGITSPQWDAAGERVVFSGLTRAGRRDLFLFASGSGELVRLTDDGFYDLDPTLHPDGGRLLFVSDRGSHGREGALNLWELELETGALRPLTDGDWWDLSPEWDEAGERIAFISTREGLRDLYVIDGEGRGARVTRSLEALMDPRWMPGGHSVLATVYHGGRMHAAVVPVPPQSAAVDSFGAPEMAPAAWSWEETLEPVVCERADYEPEFALDIAQGGIAVAPGLGSDEGVQILLRDTMGDRLLLFELGNATIATEGFFDNLSGGVTYYDLSRRINRGASGYYHAGTYYDAVGEPYFERRTGASALLSYPFSRYSRVETALGLAYSEKDKPSTGFLRHAMLATHSLSWIHDTSLWLPTGPIDGSRRHLTVGLTMNLKRPGVENAYVLTDLRRYVRLALRAALALRLQGRFSGGPDPQIFRLGGALSLRGHSRRALHGTSTVLTNAELRFPLLRGFVLVPAGVGPIGLPGVQGALFLDGARGWEEGRATRWFGAYGAGLRMGLGGMLVLRLDLARRTDFESWPRGTHTSFYIGWDY